MSKASRSRRACRKCLHPLSPGQPLNRLGLARWLVDPRNPLVGRVTVNRIWAQFFGRAIVETSEDFGVQGEPPSHPELLAWLAKEFVRQEWSLKAMRAADRHLGDLSPVVAGHTGSARSRPLQSPVQPRTAVPHGGRDGPRPGPRRQRALEAGRSAAPVSSPTSPTGSGSPLIAATAGSRARAATSSAEDSTRSGDVRHLIPRSSRSTPRAVRSAASGGRGPTPPSRLWRRSTTRLSSSPLLRWPGES